MAALPRLLTVVNAARLVLQPVFVIKQKEARCVDAVLLQSNDLSMPRRILAVRASEHSARSGDACSDFSFLKLFDFLKPITSFMSTCLTFCLPQSVSYSMSVSLSLALCVCLSVYLSHSLSASVSHSKSVCFSVYLSHSICLSLSLTPCLSVSL